MNNLNDKTVKDEMLKRLRSISQDENWIQEVLNAESTEKANRLLLEKKVKVSELQKDLPADKQKTKTAELSMDELENVTGGAIL